MINPSISVVIPVFNNEHSLSELTSRLSNHLNDNHLTFEVIYVNDASNDHSLELIKKLDHEYTGIKYIHLEDNLGQHPAIVKGLEMAKGEKIVVMDADLQDQPELITFMHNLCKDQKEAVFILRQGIYQSLGRMFTSFLIKTIVQFMSGLHYKAGSYCMLPRQLLGKVLWLAHNCPYPYISIIVGVSASKLRYIKGDRLKSVSRSGYSLFKRLKAAYQIIYCSIYCNRNLKSAPE